MHNNVFTAIIKILKYLGDYLIQNVILPSYLLENKHAYTLINEGTFIASKSKLHKKNKLYLRNTSHMMILLIKGEKVLHLEDDVHINNSQILFLSQNNYFISEIISSNNTYESILICFDDDFVLNFIKKYKLNINTTKQETVICIKKDIFLDTCVKTINEYFTKKLQNKVALLKLKTHELFLYTLSNNKDAFLAFLNNIVNTKSSRVQYILESNVDILNDISQMCQLTGLSKTALRKEMQKLYLKNPKEWLDMNRLLKAKNLLKTSNTSISDIATSCGYSSVSWFIGQFKKYYKSTPYLFRQENL